MTKSIDHVRLGPAGRNSGSRSVASPLRRRLRFTPRLLRTRAAQLYAKVEFVRENNKIVGYVISAVNVVLSGVVLFGGFMMLSTMGPIGMLAGAVLIADGMNGLTKEVLNFDQPAGHKPSQGIIADSAMHTARPCT